MIQSIILITILIKALTMFVDIYANLKHTIFDAKSHFNINDIN